MKKTSIKHLFVLCAGAALAAGCSEGAQDKTECNLPCAENTVSSVWVADNGDGTYKNPIINADYSDPDVCRVGDDYFMTASTFNESPGLPILHSTDLVNWKIVNYALRRLVPEEVSDTPRHGMGVWAPSIRHHEGTFYIYYGDPDYGLYMVKTQDPYGQWDAPVLVKAGKGMIDCCPLWDEDGKMYLVHAWARSRIGFASIATVNRLWQDGTKVISDNTLVFDGLKSGDTTLEGTKFYKKDGYYYIFAPAGGVKTGWQLVLRSKDVYGPYESRIVMHQGSTPVNGPHQGAWVSAENGEDWFIHFQDKDWLGRVVHLQPMKWVDGWPVIGSDPDQDGTGEPVLTYRKPTVKKQSGIFTPQQSDEFESESLGLQWAWQANAQQHWFQVSKLGFLRLHSGYLPEGFVNFYQVPNLLLQRCPNETFTIDTKMDFQPALVGEKAGLILMGWDYSYLAVVNTEKGPVLQQSVCIGSENMNPERIVAEVPLSTANIILRIRVEDGIANFSYSTDGRAFQAIGEPFKAREGRWIGARPGIFALSSQSEGNIPRGYADFDYFRVSK